MTDDFLTKYRFSLTWTHPAGSPMESAEIIVVGESHEKAKERSEVLAEEHSTDKWGESETPYLEDTDKGYTARLNLTSATIAPAHVLRDDIE